MDLLPRIFLRIFLVELQFFLKSPFKWVIKLKLDPAMAKLLTSASDQVEFDAIQIVVADDDVETGEIAILDASAIANGVTTARDLGNLPGISVPRPISPNRHKNLPTNMTALRSIFWMKHRWRNSVWAPSYRLLQVPSRKPS